MSWRALNVRILIFHSNGGACQIYWIPDHDRTTMVSAHTTNIIEQRCGVPQYCIIFSSANNVQHLMIEIPCSSKRVLPHIYNLLIVDYLSSKSIWKTDKAFSIRIACMDIKCISICCLVNDHNGWSA